MYPIPIAREEPRGPQPAHPEDPSKRKSDAPSLQATLVGAGLGENRDPFNISLAFLGKDRAAGLDAGPTVASEEFSMPSPKEHHYSANLNWTGAAQGPTSDYRGYSREYRVDFDGKPSITGSAEPAFLGDLKLLNPEEMLLMALSSCHMLSYLALAALEGLEVLAYEDSPSGTVEQEGYGGRFTEVTLRPRVVIAAGAHQGRALDLHADAHKTCFVSNSVNFPVRHEANITVAS
jgi:organic hydroperoxide reductase OsmC/OhrA